MELNSEVIKELPANLQEKIRSTLAPGETAFVSLPGSFGEGIVATERRVIIVREELSGIGNGPGVGAFIYPLSAFSNVEVVESTTGGVLTLEGASMPEEMEKRAVFFPTYDLEKFKTAKGVIIGLLNARSAPAPQPAQPASQSTAAAVGDNCPKCGSALRDSALFCASCGENVGVSCEVCGQSVRLGSTYCSGCGSTVVPDEGKCQGCGRVIPRTRYSYCPWCGQRLSNVCMACGAAVSRYWVNCAYCGRKLGSETMDPGALRGMYARRGAEARAGSSIFPEQPVPQTQPPQEVAAGETAADTAASVHNERGKKLFEEDDIEGAIREFKLAVDLDPENAAYHCNLAVAYDDNEDDDLALEEYQRTLELNPEDTTALLYVGYMYSENDQPEEAEKAWRRLIEIAPGTAEAEEARENLKHQGEL